MKFQRKMKMMKDKLHTILLLVALVMMVASWVMLYCSKTEPNIEKVDTVITTKIDTFYKDTTIYEKELVPKIIEKTKVDTVFSKDGDTIQLVTENKTFEKRLISDKDTADLTLYTSGIKTSLDSLKMALRTHHEVITNTVEVTKVVEKKKTFFNRFHIGAGIGYGYGLKNKDLEPFVGFSLVYNL